MNNLKRIDALLKDPAGLIEVANLCDEAYANGIGHPEYHKTFGKENPEMVAQNVAGLQAVISGIGTTALLRGAENIAEIDSMVVKILNDIVKGGLSDIEKSAMLRFANCSWGAGQSFRTDKGPLGRMTKMNVFDLLDPIEVEKDLHQVKAAAKWLLKKIE